MKDILSRLKMVMNLLLSWLCAALLLAMTFMVLYQVFTRYVLNNPAAFTEELVRYFLIWTGFIGAAYAFSTRQHMELVIFKDRLKAPAKKMLMIFIDMLILMFAIVVIVDGGIKLAMSAKKVYSALLGIPRSLVYSMAPISGVFIILAQIINIYEDVTGIAIGEGEEL